MEGTLIGTYRIERQLGRGGFGIVYVGVDTRLDRPAAIKQLLPELSGNRDIVERFFNEAKAAASIRHAGIVEIYDVGWHTDGSAYFAMKLLDGDSLARRLRSTGPLPIQLAATIARQVSSALVAAHARGIVHRDLKPDNIIMVPDDEVAIGERATVLDFGIAKLYSASATNKTATGMMMGTPLYMSPEQCRGAGEVDHRTDVYALGCILFEMLTGRPPFTGDGAGEILGKHQYVEPPPLRTLRGDAPPELEAIVARSLAKEPAQRFATMTELQAALQPFAAAGGQSRAQPAQPSPSAIDVTAPTAISERDAARVAPPVQVAPTVALPPAPTPPPMIPNSVAPPMVGPTHTTLGGAGGEVTRTPSRKPRTALFAIGGVVVVGTIVTIAVASRSSSTTTTSNVNINSPGTTQVNGETVDAGVAIATTVGVRERCARLTEERKWRELAKCAADLQLVDREKGRALVEHAILEGSAEVSLRNMAQAAINKTYEVIVVSYGGIRADSVYRVEATKAFEKYGAEFIARSSDQAKASAQANKCAQLAAQIKELGKLGVMYADKPNHYKQAREAVERIPCGTTVAPAPAPKPEETDVRKPAVNVPPTLLEGHRRTGDRNIVPDDATKTEINRSGKDKIVGSFKMCLDTRGAVSSVTALKSTGFPAYDVKITTEMRKWTYRPYIVDGQIVPVCTAVTFIYSQK